VRRDETIRVLCHAKVNLNLRVGAPIAQGTHRGYHPLRSWTHAIDLHDTLTAGRAGVTSYDLAWDSGDPFGWDPRDDLVARAHAELEEHTRSTLPAAITLRKSIPSGAGLGGGSSDAAGTLRALDAIFGLGLGARGLSPIAQGIGSDVPFFLDTPGSEPGAPPRPAIVSGLGERLERLERRDEPITLVAPPFGCETRRVYRAFDEIGRFADDLEGAEALHHGPSIAWGSLVNDLERAACLVEPRLGALASRLRAAIDAPVLMSGSGSTLVIPGSPEIPAHALGGSRVIRARLV